MRSSFFYFYFSFFLIIFIFISFSICTYFVVDKNIVFDEANGAFYTSSVLSTNAKNFIWPTPDYYYITSNFGYRTSPTTGKRSFHGGIDIGAPTGSKIVASCSGIVTYTGFYSANGFTVIISNDDYDFYYSHVSPNFIVSKNQFVTQGEVIAYVGPKNVYGVPNNPYKDSNGNPTNGSTTGPHLHFAIRKDGKAVNPLNYI